jgi:hypothetical protein
VFDGHPVRAGEASSVPLAIEKKRLIHWDFQQVPSGRSGFPLEFATTATAGRFGRLFKT